MQSQDPTSPSPAQLPPQLAPLEISYAHEASNTLQKYCHQAVAATGFWLSETGEDPRSSRLCFRIRLALIHSVLGEAVEGDRNSLKDNHLPHRELREVKLADAAISIFDLAAAYNMDLGAAIAEKLAYNALREDHKPAARAADGGKAY